MTRMTLHCVIPTQSSVIQTIHCNVGLKCFSSILPKCLFVIIIMYAYFIDISQGSLEMHLRCGGIYNNHIIANCLHSVPVKELWKSANNWQKNGQQQSGTFFGPPCTWTSQNNIWLENWLPSGNFVCGHRPDLWSFEHTLYTCPMECSHQFWFLYPFLFLSYRPYGTDKERDGQDP